MTSVTTPPRIERGAQVRKINSETGDLTPDGVRGTVVGSIGTGRAIEIDGKKIWWGYLVEWENLPGHAVFVSDFKLELIGEIDEHLVGDRAGSVRPDDKA